MLLFYPPAPAGCGDHATKELIDVNKDKQNKDNLFDYFLYSLAGGVFAVISFSLILWLRF